LLIMTGYSVVSERPRIAVDDVEAFPFCTPDQHPTPVHAGEIVGEVARLIDKIGRVPEWQREHAYSEVRAELFDSVFDYFCLSRADRTMVMETVKFVAPSIQPADYGQLTTPLLQRPSQTEIKRYVNVLASELARYRERRDGVGSLRVKAVIGGGTEFFGAVRVTTESNHNDEVEVTNSASAFTSLLGEIEAGLGKQITRGHPDDLIKMPNLMVLAGDSFYFVKPIRRRFWMVRTALSDADQIAQTVQAAAWEPAR
jgi:hypothetical protein